MNPQLAAVRLNLFRLPAYVTPREGLPTGGIQAIPMTVDQTAGNNGFDHQQQAHDE